MLNVNYEYYKIFYYVAKYSNFTRAARVLGSSQPNVTRAMNSLEQQMDCRLFIRTNRGVQLTPAGEHLYTRVSAAMIQLQAAEQELSADAGLEHGSISIGGADVRAVPKEELMDTVSFVFQNSRLIKGSILDNVKLGRPEATEEEVLAALRAAQCMDIIEKFPDGIHTVIGTKGVYLSGGEQQRISIARAFLKDAPIILLDEATASLDVENETLIQTALSRLVQNKTVLIIAHRMRSTRRMGFTPTWCSSRPAARTGRYEPRKHEGGDGLCAVTALSFLTKAASDDTIHPLMFPRG